jgi:N-acetylglucosaminyldiphosphoundecaprenol N-acetyl-beta-D-mannosaminyltransferase
MIQAKVVRLFGMDIHAVDLATAATRVCGWLAQANGPCRYVVTPNLDHAVMLRGRPDLRAAYAGASMVLADGMPLVWSSRLLGRPLPARVSGSDLVPAVLATSRSELRGELRVFLMGAAPGVASRAGAHIEDNFRHVRVVGTESPPKGFEQDDGESQRVADRISAVVPHLLIVGLGAPKQEIWVRRHAAALRARVAICAGASIDFLAGHRARAPRWMQTSGLEWLHRLMREPLRLLPRYARDAAWWPRLLLRELRAGEGGRT